MRNEAKARTLKEQITAIEKRSSKLLMQSVNSAVTIDTLEHTTPEQAEMIKDARELYNQGIKSLYTMLDICVNQQAQLDYLEESMQILLERTKPKE